MPRKSAKTFASPVCQLKICLATFLIRLNTFDYLNEITLYTLRSSIAHLEHPSLKCLRKCVFTSRIIFIKAFPAKFTVSDVVRIERM